MEIKLNCFSCQKEMIFKDQIGLRDECMSCGADAHVCKNCDFFDPKVYNECRETSAEVVRDKERSNFCDYFSPRKTSRQSEQDKAAKLRAAADALFKKT